MSATNLKLETAFHETRKALQTSYKDNKELAASLYELKLSNENLINQENNQISDLKVKLKESNDKIDEKNNEIIIIEKRLSESKKSFYEEKRLKIDCEHLIDEKDRQIERLTKKINFD